MLEFQKFNSIYLIKSVDSNTRSAGFAIIFENKTFLINPTAELVKFCCCTTSPEASGSTSSSSSSQEASGALPASEVCLHRTCYIIKSPLTEIPKSKEILLGEYHKKKYLYVPKLQLMFIFEHDMEETLTVAKRLCVARIIGPKGAVISSSELMICSIIN